MQKTVGKRICVMGPSGSGKSTFSDKLARKLKYPVLHIDQIAHIPHTNWVLGDRDETRKKHDAFIRQNTWVVDGQYPRYMPRRLERADTLVLIHANRFKCLFYFFKRCQLKGKHTGALEGATRTFTFRMIPWILWKQPQKWQKQLDIINQYPHLKIIHAYSFKELDNLLNYVERQSK